MRDQCREDRANDKQHQWHQHGQKTETVTSCNYLGSIITDDVCKPEILSRIAQTSVALTRLQPVWNDRSISVSSKIRLMLSHITSISLYACESWTPTAEVQRRIQAIEMRCHHMILLKNEVPPHDTTHLIQRPRYQWGSLWQDPEGIGPHEDLLTNVQIRNLKRYAHVSRSSGQAKTILQGT